MQLYTVFILVLSSYVDCLVLADNSGLQLVAKAELYIASYFTDAKKLECTLKLICEASGNYLRN